MANLSENLDFFKQDNLSLKDLKTSLDFSDGKIIVKPFDFAEEERCKINLLLTHYFIYKKAESEEDFIDSLIRYYKGISDQKRSFFEELFGDNKPDSLLEKMISILDKWHNKHQSILLLLFAKAMFDLKVQRPKHHI